jgi:hypothetical protein
MGSPVVRGKDRKPCQRWTPRLNITIMDELKLADKFSPDAGRIIAFLEKIGLNIRLAHIESPTFLPGVCIEPGGLVVDPEKLLYAGDLLHEAGHLAVMLPEQRVATGPNVGSDMGDEIAAQCWSYAAAVHLGLAPDIVFHANGYHQSAQTLISVYREGKAGLPLLQWMGLTLDSKCATAASLPAWPHMIRWLRAE